MPSVVSHVRAADGTDILVRHWTGEASAGAPWASVLLVHGLGEHSGRYEHVGEQMAAAGLDVHAYDLRGNGGSGGRRGHVDRWEQLPRRPRRAARGRQGGGRDTARRPLRPLDGWSHRPRLPPERAPESRTSWSSRRRVSIRRSPRGRSRSRRPCRGSSRRWPSRTGSTARRCRATRPSPRAFADDPLAAKASTARFAAEGLTEQARVRREYAGLTLPTLVLHGLDDGLVPARGVGDPRHAPERGAADLPRPPPRAPQRTGGTGDRRRDHRLDPGPDGGACYDSRLTEYRLRGAQAR